MKVILSFIAGVITGIVGVNLYGIFVKPVMPSEEISDEECAKILAEIDEEITGEFDVIYDTQAVTTNETPHPEKMYNSMAAYSLRKKADPDDTQPAKVSDE